MSLAITPPPSTRMEPTVYDLACILVLVVLLAQPSGYAVTSTRNGQSEHWRGLLRGYEVTRPPVYVRVCVRMGGMGQNTVGGARNCVTK